jgi:PAS domain S-box-containing protein
MDLEETPRDRVSQAASIVTGGEFRASGWSIRRRLTLVALAVAIPMLVLLATVVWQLGAREREGRLQAILYSSRGVMSAVDAQLARYVTIAQTLAASPSLQDGTLAAFRHEAERALPGLAGSWVALADARGQQVVNTLVPASQPLPQVAPSVLADEIKAFETRQMQISDLVIGPVAKVPVVTVGMPVFRAGEPAYYLMIGIDARVFQGLLDSQRIPEGWLEGIVDRSGTFIARSRDPQLWVGKPMAPAWGALRYQEGWHDIASVEGDVYVSTSLVSSVSGWTLGAAIRNDVFAAEIRRSLLFIVLTGAGLVLLSIVLAAWAAQRIAKPIRRLKEGAQALQRHETAPLSPTGVPEVDEALLAFRDAARAIGEKEDRLRLAKAETESIMATISEGFYSLDDEWRFVFINDAARQLLGLHGRNVLGLSIVELFPHLEGTDAYALARQVMAERKPLTFEAVGPISGRWVAFNLQPSIRGGISVQIRDISARKLAGEMLSAAKQEAERANLAKSKFLAAASHDLRQPVQAMILFAHALAKKLKGHAALPVLEKMMKAQDAFKELLDSVLDLSKLDAGLVTPDQQPVDSSDLLDELAASYRMRAREKGLKFKVRRCDAWLWADRTLLARILGNLLDNAIKYTPKGGILLSGTRSGDRLRFDVADTGIGFVREHQEEIFREFVQLGEVGREQRQGMGLGLATVKRLCDLLDYDMKVWSRPGWGSKFSVFVPLAVPAAGVLATESAKVTEAGKRLLVIDDDTAILESIKILTEEWGYEVVTATSFAQALDQVDRCGPPDVIVADFRLGGGVTDRTDANRHPSPIESAT